MAKVTKVAPIVDEIEDEVDDLLDQLEEEDIDDVEATEDDVEEVAAPKKAKPAKAAKEPKAKKEPKPKAEKDPNEVTVADLAEILQVDGRELRMFLRANFTRPEESKSSKWAWTKGDAQIQVIIDAFKAKKAAPRNPKKKLEADAPEVKVVE